MSEASSASLRDGVAATHVDMRKQSAAVTHPETVKGGITISRPRRVGIICESLCEVRHSMSRMGDRSFSLVECSGIYRIHTATANAWITSHGLDNKIIRILLYCIWTLSINFKQPEYYSYYCTYNLVHSLLFRDVQVGLFMLLRIVSRRKLLTFNCTCTCYCIY